MKGSVPIPYIVGFILAVVVIITVSYTFLDRMGFLDGIFLKKFCDAKCFEWNSKSEAFKDETGSFDEFTGDVCSKINFRCVEE